MFMRMDRLLIDIPRLKEPDPNAAAAIQELLGGKFGEMSTLNNYLHQSFNFRGRNKVRPFYDLVANITAEELGHVELVTTAVNMCLEGYTKPGDPDDAPLMKGKDMRNSHHFIASAQTSMLANSMGQPWTGDYVFNSGNLVLDLLHNFFLECGARTHKMRVYEMTDNPVAREIVGYLLVRGGVHVMAYAKALEKLTGVEMTKMLPIPNLENKAFSETRKFEEKGLHRAIYRFSPNDYKEIDKIWNGVHPEDGQPLYVKDGPPEGAPIPDLEEKPEMFSPGLSSEEIEELAARLSRNI